MGMLDRISRLTFANVNNIVSKAEDPEKILEQAVIDMQEYLLPLRQAASAAMVTQKRFEQQYNKAVQDEASWHKKAQIAFDQGNEAEFTQARLSKIKYAAVAVDIKDSLRHQTKHITEIKQNLVQMECMVSEAKSKKDLLKARIQSAIYREKIHIMVNRFNKLLRADWYQSISIIPVPEKLLDDVLQSLQQDVGQMRQYVDIKVATKTNAEQQYKISLKDAEYWQHKAQIAAAKGYQDLAQEALLRSKKSSHVAEILKSQIDGKTAAVELLKQYLSLLNSQIADFQQKMDENKYTSPQ
jgi:phage shock protein A